MTAPPGLVSGPVGPRLDPMRLDAQCPENIQEPGFRRIVELCENFRLLGEEKVCDLRFSETK